VFVIAAAVSFSMIFKGYGSGGPDPVAHPSAVGAGRSQAAQTARRAAAERLGAVRA
jgi:hypothetical protein